MMKDSEQYCPFHGETGTAAGGEPPAAADNAGTQAAEQARGLAGGAAQGGKHGARFADDTRKTLVLTGASRGIGHATVKRFSSEGWRVITCSRQSFSPQTCPWAEGAEDHIGVNLADAEDVGRAIAEIRRRLEANGGRLHALVNNAGISPKSESGRRLNSLETNMQIWRAVFQVNFYAPIMLARGLFAELKAAHGAIVNVTSIAGGRVHPFAGTAYATSKAALAALTREMASDFGPHNVRVNAIAPGEIATGILSPGTEKMAEHLPLRRLGRPEEVADTIYYLCGEGASYVTGSEIHINGGQHV
ncbi:SDR family NAD(P)-dependent oxidoreductase [Candidatus Tokpelaia sp.]|uniref:SDR family NAD(P)-dependent oxidoreductase n=1 Tax=Candidatus Tokpelaia sp. TaxID=2233777 RepID=UPI001FEF0261|nr:SDR family oxidoreductase [Candidatus Tokpelaia sp.]